jgi:predicted MFS family arabinose efflux permease
MMIALLPAGWAVDMLGEHHVLIAGGIMTGLLAATSALAPGLIVLAPLLILVGAAAATPTPAGSTAIISAFPLRDRGLVMSVRQTGVPLGGVIAALLLPPVALLFGWRQALVFAAAFAILGALGSFWLLRRVTGQEQLATRGERGAWRTIATRDGSLIGLAAIFLALGQFVLITYIALYLVEVWRLPVTLAELYLVAANAGGVIGRLLWGVISDRLFAGNRRSPLILASLMAAAGFGLLAWLPLTTPAAAILVLVLFLGTTVIGWNGIYIALLSEMAPPDKRGRSVAYGMMITQIGIFAGPFAFGSVVDITRSYRIAWTLVAFVLVLAGLVLRQVHEPMHEQPNQDGMSGGTDPADH